jgi:hypothetical protein
VLSICVCVLVAACSGEPQKPATAPSPAVASLMLKAEPANPLGVKAAKAKGEAEQVAVTGRVASTLKGFAILSLMDLDLPYCGEKNKDDHCKTPWDWCCDSKEKISEHRLAVEVRGGDGKPLATPSLGDVRLLDQLTVTGRLVTDDQGKLVLLASGWFRKARPDLPADLKWPQ